MQYIDTVRESVRKACTNSRCQVAIAYKIFMMMLRIVFCCITTSAWPIKDDRQSNLFLHFFYPFHIFISFPAFSLVAFLFVHLYFLPPFPPLPSWPLKQFPHPCFAISLSFYPLSSFLLYSFPISSVYPSYHHSSSLHILAMARDHL